MGNNQLPLGFWRSSNRRRYKQFTNSTYIYPAPGIYPVSLTVIDSYGLSAGGDATNISVYPSEDPPSANFSWATDLLEVSFTDESTEGDTTITSWSWDFGDNCTATVNAEYEVEETNCNDSNVWVDQHPVHAYADAGTYSVSLIVTDANGLPNISAQDVTVISVLVGPTASFTHSGSYLTIQFTDNSDPGDGDIISRVWDFGDEESSTQQNPTHTYAEADTFVVSLTVTDTNDSTDTYSDSVITVENLQTGPSVSFAYSTDSLTVTFVDLSSVGTDPEGDDAPIENWGWNFGDGESSTQQDPVHTYSSEGIYNVSLTVTDANDLSDSHSEQVVLGIYFTASVNASGGGNEYDLTFGFSPLSTDGFDASHCLDSQGNPLPEYTDRTSCLSGPFDSGEFGECPSCTTPEPPNLFYCEQNECTWVSIHTWVEGDEYAPPAPPPPAFDAVLGWDGDRYFTQILAGLYEDAGVEHVYDIALAYSADNLITVTWDNTGFSDMMNFCVLQDAFGGAFVNIDMITGDGTTNAAFASWDGTTLSLFNTAVNTLKLKVTPAAPSR
jgi:PKD repeat protein